MSKSKYLNFIKIFIFLSPIPFGCIGKVFSPLFYLSLLLLSFIGLSVNDLKHFSNKKAVLFAFQNKIKYLVIIFFGFIVFQLLPLPASLVKMVSPATTEKILTLNGYLPNFVSLSLVPVETLLFALRMLTIFIFFFSFVRINFKRKELVSVIKILIFSVSLQGLFGLIKYLTGNKFFFLIFHRVVNDPTKEFLTGTLGNPNHFAFYVEMVFPLLIALFFMRINLFNSTEGLRESFVSAFNASRGVILIFVLIPFFGLIVILTGSRSGIVTIVISFLIFALLTVYLRRAKAIRRKLKIIFVVLSLIVVFVGAKNTVNKFMKKDYFNNSGRFLRWPNTINMFKDHPIFGVGFGTYKYSFYLYDTDNSGTWSTNAHNEYLETLSEGGLIGSIIFLFLIGMLVYSVAKMWRSRRHPDIKILGIGILTSLFVVFFHSIFDFSLRIPSNSFVLILLFGLGVQLATCRREFTEDGNRLRRNKVSSTQIDKGRIK